jgi:hypothetical protein
MLSSTLVTYAMAFAEMYALRGYDAVQLAAAVEVQIRGDTLGFQCGRSSLPMKSSTSGRQQRS